MVAKSPKNKEKIEMKIKNGREIIPMKKTKGRQKIEMRRIEKENEMLISFSKRRFGICKKSSEMITLTGALMSFLVFSPSGKAYSFSHPSIDYVTNRFMEQEEPQDVTDILLEANRQNELNNLVKRYNQLLYQLNEKKEEAKQLEQKMKGKNIECWWNIPVTRLNEEDISKHKKSCKNLLKRIFDTIKDKNNGASSSSNPSHIDLWSNFLASINISEDELPFIPPPTGYN